MATDNVYVGYVDPNTGKFVEAEEAPPPEFFAQEGASAGAGNDPPPDLSTAPALTDQQPLGVFPQPGVLPLQEPERDPGLGPEGDPCVEMVDLQEQITAAQEYLYTLQNRCQTTQNVQQDKTLQESICKSCGSQHIITETSRPTPQQSQHPLSPLGTQPQPRSPGSQQRPLTSGSDRLQEQQQTGQRPVRPLDQGTSQQRPLDGSTRTAPETPQSGIIPGLEKLPTGPQVNIVPEHKGGTSFTKPQGALFGDAFPGQRNPAGTPPGPPAGIEQPPPPPPPPPVVEQTFAFQGGVNIPPINIPPINVGGTNFGGGYFPGGSGPIPINIG